MRWSMTARGRGGARGWGAYTVLKNWRSRRSRARRGSMIGVARPVDGRDADPETERGVG